MTIRTYQAIRAHVSGEYRTETLLGKEYIVVPVVALVEGVIQGMSAEGPELALADEFGRFPDSWNGRPIVMSHPVVDGSPVSANSPEMITEYAIGSIFNANLNGDKLELEAWVESSRMNSLNDDSKDTISRLQKGEKIEVSTGYFAQLEAASGLYNNTKYDAIQRNIVPDHLAFLPNGTIGACSNADGCGAQLTTAQMRANQTKTFFVQQPCCEACAHGDHTHCEDTMPKDNTPAEITTQAEDAMSKGKKKGKKGDPKSYQGPTAQERAFVAQSLPAGMLIDDAEYLVSCALKETQMYTYVVGLTSDVVIYEQYNQFSGYYETYQQGYSVSAEGVVTLNGDAQRVELITKIVAANADGSTKETAMPETNETAAPAAEPKVETITNDQGTLEVHTSADGKTSFKFAPKANATPAKPATLEELIAQASPEMQEVMKSSLALHKSKKDGLIKALKDSKRCKFDDAYLAAQSVETLENMAELASVPTFEGRALPEGGVNANAGDDQAPPALLVFERPAA